MLLHSYSSAPPFRSVAITVGVAMLVCAVSGCRAPVHNTRVPHRPAHAVPPTTQTVGPSHVENANGFYLPEAPPPSAAEQLPPTEVEVSDSFRQVGGKLRPNEAGEIVEIDLSYSEITDAQLTDIIVFGEVTELDLTGTAIHDDGVSALSSMKNLRSVKLKGTKITNDGFKQLSVISNLIFMDASSTAVSDEGLELAGEWSNLRYLSLNNTTISDAGLTHLETLRELKGLSVINTAVTDAGVRSLKKQLPECLIVAQTARELGRNNSEESLPRLPDLGPLNSSTAGIASQNQLAQVVQLAGQQPHLAVHLSQVYSSREQWAETAQILAVAAAADPGNATIHFHLGEALARSGRPAEALVHFEQAVDEATARYQVAMIVYENSLKDCERLFDDALAVNPSLKAAESRLNHIHQEIAQLHRRRSEPAVQEQTVEPFDVVPAPAVRNVSRTRVIPR